MNSSRLQRNFYSSLKIFSIIMTVISLVALCAIILYVVINGASKVSLSLLFGDGKKSPTILPAIVGTLELVAISIVIAVPIGIGTAIFLTEYTNTSSKIVKVIRISTETLAGIPSIVYGLFGYLIFVTTFKFGYGILCGGLTLSIMILPTIIRSVEESLLSVPKSLKEGSYALGTSKVRTIFKIVLPSAKSGIITAVVLSIGRVISESAVLILTIGMVVNKMPTSIMSPGTSLALDIYYFASHGYPDEAMATSFVLILFILILNLTTTLISRIVSKKKGE